MDEKNLSILQGIKKQLQQEKKKFCAVKTEGGLTTAEYMTQDFIDSQRVHPTTWSKKQMRQWIEKVSSGEIKLKNLSEGAYTIAAMKQVMPKLAHSGEGFKIGLG